MVHFLWGWMGLVWFCHWKEKDVILYVAQWLEPWYWHYHKLKVKVKVPPDHPHWLFCEALCITVDRKLGVLLWLEWKWVVYCISPLSNQGHFSRRVPAIIISEAVVAYCLATSFYFSREQQQLLTFMSCIFWLKVGTLCFWISSVNHFTMYKISELVT